MMKAAMLKLNNSLTRPFTRLPDWLLALVVRGGVFIIFWRSVQSKISGGEFLGQYWQFWNINGSTFTLFKYEYSLPLLPPEFAAYLATFAEFFFSLLILFGLLTRFSALAFLIMTLTIQIFVYPSAWSVHILWAGLLLYLLKYGPGKVSLDRLAGLA